MKKQAVTLETIAQTLEHMQANAKQVNLKLDKLDKLEEMQLNMQSNIVRIDSTLDNIQRDLSDTQDNVHYLVKDALMRDELQPIINREITQSESRMISHMEGFIRRHVTMEEEVVIHGHKIGVIERVLGLPNAV